MKNDNNIDLNESNVEIIENENNNKKRPIKVNKKVVIVALLLMLVSIIVPVSYAFFTATVTGNNTANPNVIQAGTMSLTLSDGAVVGTTTDWVPGTSLTKSFTVENTGSLSANYTISLENVTNNFVDKTDLVYEIVGTTSGTSAAFNTTTAVQAPDSDGPIISNQSINSGETHSYVLTLRFLSKDENQDDNQGKTFSGKLQLHDASDLQYSASDVGFSSSYTAKKNVSDALDELYDLLS